MKLTCLVEMDMDTGDAKVIEENPLVFSKNDLYLIGSLVRHSRRSPGSDWRDHEMMDKIIKKIEDKVNE